MTRPPFPAETLHATSVAIGGRAVLISGPSGAGKSDLALRLIDRGFTLVSDDRTIVSRDGERLIASAPARIAGKLEVRGLGIMDAEALADVPLALAVELTGEVERMPEPDRCHALLGVDLPLISLDPRAPSAAAKVALALDRFGIAIA